MSQCLPSNKLPLFESFCRKNQIDGIPITIEVGGNPLRVKVASTPESQAKGFMGATTEPKEGEGILFVYDDEQPLHFWMKDVPFSLDIAFFNNNMEYMGHETMQPTDEREEHKIPRYSSKGPARFAVETKAGWCDKHVSQECKLSL